MVIEAIKNWSLAHDNRNGIVSLAQAQTLFDTLANQPDIPFNYKDNGCYARAQVMIDRMAQSGPLKLEQIEKAYVTGDLHVATDQPYDAVTITRDDGTVVSYDIQNSHDGILDWTYHIAPLVYVRQPDGSIAEMIIDPSLADKPITRQEWEALMGGPDAILESNVVDHTWYGILSPEDQASSDEEYQQNSENALKELDMMLRECQDRGYCK